MIEFSIQQRRALKELIKRPPICAKESLAENFLLRYVFFESICRLICKYYRERAESRKKPASKGYESIQIDVVERAFSHFGVFLRKERLVYLLDSSQEKRGAKSARNLRNGIVHRWDKNDVEEALRRYSNLCLALDAVVDAISHRANGVSK